MYDLTIIKENGSVYIDSREVAVVIGKPHNDLMKAIRKYCEYLTAGNFSLSEFFINATYSDSTGRTLPCYLLTKMGCEMIANKLTGEKGILFTAVYVKKFNDMEDAELAKLEARITELSNDYALLSAMPKPRLGEFNACARIIVRSLRNIGATSEQIIRFLKGVYEPLGIAVAEDDEFDDVPQMYTAKQIAKKLGLYSLNGNPHYQAVSCILNENVFIGDKHKSVITNDYGAHIGISVRYDDYAVQSARNWLIEHGLPNEIYGFERTYNVLYKD